MSVPGPGPQLSFLPNPNVAIRVVHSDPQFLIVCKAAGVVTQPGEGQDRNTVLNGLFATHGTTLQNLGKVRDFGLVHRLDRPTSGLLVVALTADAYAGLRAQFAEHKVKKTYLTLVHNAPNPPDGTERSPLAEVREGGRKRAKLGEGHRAQAAVTRYQTLVRAKGLTLVECHPETGRLHQIRAHMAHRGCPVVGDREYGVWEKLDQDFAKLSKGLFLHAAELSFAHPMSGRAVSFSAPLPTTWVEFLNGVGIACPRKWRDPVT